MKKMFNGLGAIIMALLLLLPLTFTAKADAPTFQATILFTHDLHSHLLPSAEADGGEYGGYARLMTAIRQQKGKYPDAVLVDGGDFSMGSLFQTAYPTAALELRTMGAMGYDATTFGNHEFDYLPQGVASMLNVAAGYETVPVIVDANYLPPQKGQEGYTTDSGLVWEAFRNYGVKEYILLERGGIYYAIFGLVGIDSNDCAPQSGMILEDPAQAAQRIVDQARAECWEKHGVQPLVIVLSHSGTKAGQGEDYELAQNVEGIDLIISGHTHTTMDEPLRSGETWIVSAGEYGRNLGVVQMAYKPNGEVTLMDYELIPIDETVEDDPQIASLVETMKKEVEQSYLSNYGMTFDQVLTNNPYKFDTVDDCYDVPHESTLGNVFTDAYKKAVEDATGKNVDLAVTASGVIRESIPVGEVRVSDIFNAASLGVGTEGELVAIYLTGSDLRSVFEVDASVYPLMHSAQIFSSGAEYSYNTNRMIFNRVDHAMLRRDDGTLEAIEEDKLYCVVVGMYVGQMLGSVEETSMELLKLTPRDADGNPIDMTKIADYIVYDAEGKAVKEWYAIASYLDDMGETMDEKYGAPDGRKTVYSSWNPVSLLRNANKFTYILIGAVFLLIFLAVCISRAVLRRVRRGK